MDTQKVLLATVVGGITLFIAGYLIYGVALAGFFESNAQVPGVMKETPVWWALGVGQLAGAFFLTFIFDRWARVSGVGPGAKAGATIGFLMGVANGFTSLGVTNLATIATAVVEPFAGAVYFGIGGAVVGLMLGRGRSAAAV